MKQPPRDPVSFDTIEERLPPHSVEAEEAVLGSLLIDPDAFFEVENFLQAADFYRAGNRWVYEGMQALREARTPIDVVTLIEELRRRERLAELGGEGEVIRLLNAVPTSINAEAYGRMVYEAAVRRRVIAAAGQIAKIAWDQDGTVDGLVGNVERVLFDATRDMTGTAVVDARAAFSELFDETLERRTGDGPPIGLPSGLVDLDRLLGGFKRGDLYIIAGRPSMGKSALATSIISHIAGPLEKRVMLFTLEMSAQQQVRRLITQEVGVDYASLERGDLDDAEWARFAEVSDRWTGRDLWIDDTAGISLSQLSARARRVHAEHGLDAIFVDYIGLMSVDEKAWSENHEMTLLSKGLKKLAKELNVPVICAAQLNRSPEGRSDKRPMLSDLRSSGSIEQDADVVMFLYRDEYYKPDTTDTPGVMEIIIAKHRNGPLGTVSLYFHKKYARVKNLYLKEIDL